MSVDTRSLLEDLRRGWRVGLIVVLGVPIAAAVFTARQTPVYRAATTVVVAPAEAMAEPTDALRAVEVLERRSVLATFAELSKSPTVRSSAAERLDWEEGRLTEYRLASTVMPHANVLRLSAEGPDAEGVAAFTRAVATVLAGEASGLYRSFSVRVLSAATAPAAPILPDRRRNYLVALVVGLFLGAVGAYAFGRLAPEARRPVGSRRRRPAHAAAE